VLLAQIRRLFDETYRQVQGFVSLTDYEERNDSLKQKKASLRRGLGKSPGESTF